MAHMTALQVGLQRLLKMEATSPTPIALRGLFEALQDFTSRSLQALPGKPVGSNNRPLSINYELLWGIVAHYFGLLGFPGRAPSTQTNNKIHSDRTYLPWVIWRSWEKTKPGSGGHST